MRKIREILRLRHELALSKRQIARAVSVPHSTVIDLLYRAEAAGLRWPLPEPVDEMALEAQLYPGNPQPAQPRPEPDYAEIHRELRRKGVTLQLLWKEYRHRHPDGYQYTQFCQRYRAWEGTLDLVLRQSYRPGEKMFVDYAGQMVPVVDPKTGEVHEASIFVAVLAASNYTYVEATWVQDLAGWIGAQCRAFEFFGGVSEILVPDNPKAVVSRACRYEPDLNPTYQDLASHYGTAVIPARPRKPRDKAKVESAVLVVERWILAALRNRKFFSLAELNQAIAELLEELNEQPFQKLEGSRRSLYETLEKPVLRPLPPQRYQFAIWKKAQVHIDYHVEVTPNYYSAPYQLAKKRVDVRITATTVEVLHGGRRVASHQRSYRKGQFITDPKHLPPAHQKYLEWTPARLVRWAETVGPQTGRLVQVILADRPHPEQGFRSCLGIMRLSTRYTPERVEAAAARALHFGAHRYQSVKSILEKGLDRQPLVPSPSAPPVREHANVRGAGYYQGRLLT